MDPLNSSAASSPPEFAGILRNRLERLTVKAIAAEISVDPSHVGKVLNGSAALRLDDVQKLIKLAGLKVVDESRTCLPKAEVAYLRGLYRRVSDTAPWLLDEEEV